MPEEQKTISEYEKKISEINQEIEKLRDEEMSLYKIIKKRHPSLSDEQIKTEVHQRIS